MHTKVLAAYFQRNICTPTRRLENAYEDLAYFRQLPQAPPVAEVRAIAYDAGTYRPYPELAGLPGARLTLSGMGVHQSATTDSAGWHVFSGLPPGAYTVSGSLPNYESGAPTKTVNVHSKGCAVAAIPLAIRGPW
jgi:hypothetical protein